MPVTASNFIDLVNRDFYDGFIIQFGCPFAKEGATVNLGMGGPEPNTYFKN